jgi:hypothetical protein
VPKYVPPVAASYQFILFPDDVAFRFVITPEHKDDGIAVTGAGAAGIAVKLDTVALACVFQQPLLYALK